MLQNKRTRTVILTTTSAIIIVLSWFILNYLFNKYGDMFYISLAFFAIYFGIEIINYKFSELEYGVYAILQGFLDFVIFILAVQYLGRFVCFIPVNTPENPNAAIKALVYYIQEYAFAFFLSNIIMLVIWGIDKYKMGKR